MRVIATTIFFSGVVCGAYIQAKPGDVDELYTSIGARLADVKKQAPACAPVLGVVLDDFDRMYKATKVSQQQDNAAMKELENKVIENASLQKELSAAKQRLEALEQMVQEDQLKIAALTKELEKERAQAAQLKEQNAQIQQKTGSQQDLISAEISKMAMTKGGDEKIASSRRPSTPDVALAGAEPNQNLNRTSTSDPSSPR